MSDSLVHLNVGELIVADSPLTISTVLGSCVSVCLFSKSSKIGGMTHFALPQAPHENVEDPYRYGDLAIEGLILAINELGSGQPSDLCAKVIGGAEDHVQSKVGFNIGLQNIHIAEEILSKYNIPIVGSETGGSNGRKVLFSLPNGEARVAQLRNQSPPETKISLQKTLPSQKKMPVKVLIVDDSKTVRELLKRVISEDPELEIIGMAADVFEAEALIKKNKPDVITLDIQMPKMTGVEWLAHFFPKNPIPVIMISSLQLQEGSEVFRALELGAVDYIQKPTFSRLKTASIEIREKIKAAATAKLAIKSNKLKNRIEKLDFDAKKIFVLGASTGGTEAIKDVLMALPEVIPPMVIVQHIPPVFSKAFADRLNQICPFEVKE